MDRPRRKIRNVTAILEEIWGSDDKDDSNNGKTDFFVIVTKRAILQDIINE